MSKDNKPTVKLWTKDFSILTIANMLFTFGFYMMIPLIPLYVFDRGGLDPQVGIVAASFSVSAIIMRFITPIFLGKVSKTAVLKFGLGLSVVVTVGFILTKDVPGIIAFRMLQGIGFGAVSTICSTLAADLLPDSRRGEGIGYFGMGTTAMVAFSPAIGLFLARTVSFDAAFITSSVGHLLSLICIATIFKPDQELINPKPTPGKKFSILDKLYDPALILQTIILVFFGIARSAEQNFLPLLAEKYNVAALLSIYYIVQTVVSFFAKFLTGRIYDKRGHAWAIIPGAICLACCYFFMAIADNFWILMVSAFFSGTGMGALLPGMQTWTVTSVAADKRSTASAVYYNFYDIGQGIGAALLGLMAVNLGYKITFRLAIIPIIIFLIIYLIGTRIQKAKTVK